MRVLIVADRTAEFRAPEAARIVAAGWAQERPGTQLAVVPVSVGGPDLADVLTALGGELQVVSAAADVPVEGIPLEASSQALGVATLAAVESGVRHVVVDATGLVTHDGGAGFLAALGARADVPLDAGVQSLGGLTRIELTAVRERLAGVRLSLVVSAADARQQLLGLRGITSTRRRDGDDPAFLLATDQALADYAQAVHPDAGSRPGSGAAGGLGFAVSALGGEVLTGPELCARQADLDASWPVADLVVVVTDRFDFGGHGGEVVRFVSDRAQQHLRPCVVLAATVAMSGREMRTLAIESAYGVHDGGRPGTPGPLGSDQLAELARRVARTWSW